MGAGGVAILLAFVSGPYRSADGNNGIHNNIEAARECAIELWRAGFAVICPHLNTAYMDGALGGDDCRVWLDGDLEMLSRCDLVVVEGYYQRSKGTLGEIAHAEKLGILVYFYPKDWGALAMMPSHAEKLQRAAEKAAGGKP